MTNPVNGASTLRVACVQTCATPDITENIQRTLALIRETVADGVQLACLPEYFSGLTTDGARINPVAYPEEKHPALQTLRDEAIASGVWILLGSLGVLSSDGRVLNRSYLIDGSGNIAARYDKIHMFDVDLPNGESWRESATYEPGRETVIADLPFARFGMAICYDVRFPAIFRTQARNDAEVLTGPAAFTRQTGEAHWHVLQRARAIENGAYIISAAQGGLHEDGRETYGHSLVVDPWGGVLAELENDEPGYILAEIEIETVSKARGRIPAIANERAFDCHVAEGLKEIPA